MNINHLQTVIFNFVDAPMNFLTIAEHVDKEATASELWIALSNLVQEGKIGGYNGMFYPKQDILKVARIDEMAILPKYQTEGSACFDIYSICDGVVEPNESVIFSTGLKFEIAKGWAVEVYSRSGHGFKDNVRLSNCVGQIDSDYKGELKVSLFNDSDKPFYVHIGDRIAQGKQVISEQCRIMEISEDDMTDSERGEGGFGSTGK